MPFAYTKDSLLLLSQIISVLFQSDEGFFTILLKYMFYYSSPARDSLLFLSLSLTPFAMYVCERERERYIYMCGNRRRRGGSTNANFAGPFVGSRHHISLSLSLSLFLYIYIYIHTYMYVSKLCIYIYICIRRGAVATRTVCVQSVIVIYGSILA